MRIIDYIITLPFLLTNKRFYKTIYFNITYKKDTPHKEEKSLKSYFEVYGDEYDKANTSSTNNEKVVELLEPIYAVKKENKISEEEYRKEMKSPFVSLIKTLLGKTIHALEFSVIEDSHYRGITITLNRRFHIKNDDNAIYNNMGAAIGGWDSVAYSIEVFLTAQDLQEHTMNPGKNSVLARTLEALILIYKKQVIPGELYKVNGTTVIFKETHGDNWSFVVMDGDKVPLSTTRFGVSAIETIEKMEA